MSWFAIFVWVLVGAFCIYMVVEINRTKTSAEKISLIRDEMDRVDKMIELNTQINTTREKSKDEWSNMYKSGIRVYDNIWVYITQTVETIIQIIIDIISPRLYSLIG